MKKLFTVLAVCFAVVATSNAQQQALGLRLGGGSVNGGEITYQKDLGSANRLEADLGFWGDADYSGIALTGIYQWVWDLEGLGDGFKWYAGPGAGLRAYNGLGLGIHGQIGIEYTLAEVPLQFSLDARPGWYVGGGDGFGYGAALSIRYKF